MMEQILERIMINFLMLHIFILKICLKTSRKNLLLTLMLLVILCGLMLPGVEMFDGKFTDYQELDENNVPSGIFDDSKVVEGKVNDNEVLQNGYSVARYEQNKTF